MPVLPNEARLPGGVGSEMMPAFVPERFMDPAALAVFALALLVAAATPGPGVAAVVARVLGRGRAGAAAFTAGLAFGDIVWLTAAIVGLAALAEAFHLAFVVVKWLGIGYLLFLAWRMVNAPANEALAEPPAGESGLTLFAAGLGVTLGNPKVMVFYLALLPSLLDLRSVTLLGYAELVAVAGAVLALVFSGYVLLALRARALLASATARARVTRGAALGMAGAAGWIAAR
jgi:threonine/homoserine/homoserine lactone efflux protein